MYAGAGLGSSSAIASNEDIQQRGSRETAPSHNSDLASQNSISPAAIKEMNDRFLNAVKELDTVLIHNWIKDPVRRSRLSIEHIHSALLVLAGIKQAKGPQFRFQAINVIIDEF